MKYIVSACALILFFTGCTATTQAIQKKEAVKNNISVKKKIAEKKVEKNTQQVQDKSIQNANQTLIINELQIIGEAEYVYLPSSKLRLKARIDTGATTTSINALNIKQFERDGKKWVKFDLMDEKNNKHTKKLPLYENIKIKRHGVEDQIRPVVKIRVNLGSFSKFIRVSLTDRSKFTYPVLIGRNFLNGTTMVDVSRKYSVEPKKSRK